MYEQQYISKSLNPAPQPPEFNRCFLSFCVMVGQWFLKYYITSPLLALLPPFIPSYIRRKYFHLLTVGNWLMIIESLLYYSGNTSNDLPERSFLGFVKHYKHQIIMSNLPLKVEESFEAKLCIHLAPLHFYLWVCAAMCSWLVEQLFSRL